MHAKNVRLCETKFTTIWQSWILRPKTNKLTCRRWRHLALEKLLSPWQLFGNIFPKAICCHRGWREFIQVISKLLRFLQTTRKTVFKNWMQGVSRCGCSGQFVVAALRFRTLHDPKCVCHLFPHLQLHFPACMFLCLHQFLKSIRNNLISQEKHWILDDKSQINILKKRFTLNAAAWNTRSFKSVFVEWSLHERTGSHKLWDECWKIIWWTCNAQCITFLWNRWTSWVYHEISSRIPLAIQKWATVAQKNLCSNKWDTLPSSPYNPQSLDWKIWI